MMIVGNTAKSPAARRAYEDRREALIKEFAPTIKYLASRLAVRLPSYLDAEDLFSVGLIGLLNAFDRYDPTREAKFKTYAEYRIRGAMLDEIRSMDWIPRSVRDRITLLQRTCDGLQKRHGRPPTEEEIGEAMGLNQEELCDFLVRSQGAFVLSLDDLASQEPEPRILLQCMADPKAADPLAELVSESKRKQLAGAIEGLPNKERMVLTLYYYEELTMKEIGATLDLSESRVSQMHSSIVARLQGQLLRRRPEFGT